MSEQRVQLKDIHRSGLKGVRPMGSYMLDHEQKRGSIAALKES
jgi:hypothetical protein